MVAGLTADTYLHAMSIAKHKINFKDLHLSKSLLVGEPDIIFGCMRLLFGAIDPCTLPTAMQQMVDEAVDDDDIYSKLAKSLAPEIYGHIDVKKVG